MDIRDFIMDVTRAADVRTVFGEPIERDGVTIVPVATVRAGGGGGGGDGPPAREGVPSPAPDGGPDRPEAPGGGVGGGYGVTARPVGIYVIRDGDVRFQPALDLPRIILGGQLVAALALLVARSILKRRR